MKKTAIILTSFLLFSSANACISENIGIETRQLVKAWIVVNKIYKSGNISAKNSLKVIYSGMNEIEKKYVNNFNSKLITTNFKE